MSFLYLLLSQPSLPLFISLRLSLLYFLENVLTFVSKLFYWVPFLSYFSFLRAFCSLKLKIVCIVLFCLMRVTYYLRILRRGFVLTLASPLMIPIFSYFLSASVCCFDFYLSGEKVSSVQSRSFSWATFRNLGLRSWWEALRRREGLPGAFGSSGRHPLDLAWSVSSGKDPSLPTPVGEA